MSEEAKLDQIIYESINTEYGYGMYENFKVQAKEKKNE